jgi:osmoprotectant transport system permease protein
VLSGLAALVPFAAPTASGRATAAAAAEATPPLRVGTKHFTEQIILGEVLAQTLERGGIPVERRFNLQGTLFCFEALRTGGLDLYPEYTGTGLVAILHGDVPSDPRMVIEAVRQEFRERWRMVWLAPLGFNNTYALALRRETAARLNVKTISDLVAHASGLVLGCGTEFLARSDGYPGLKARYELSFREARALDPNLTYKAVKDGQVDVIDAYATDGRVKAFDLVTLVDDKGFFPPYDARVLVREDALTQNPEMRSLLDRLAYKLDDETMRELNHRADSGGEQPAAIASAFLDRLGIGSRAAPGPGGPAAASGTPPPPVPAPAPSGTTWPGVPAPARPGALASIAAQRAVVARLALEHLQLTGIAVALASLAGIPFGILLTRARALAGPALAAVSVLQTVPSLALLGFLIPITGLGPAPAIVALLVYALLPIVRNTYLGITGIEPDLKEAGRGMGMTDLQLLAQVELPLALPVLMGGVRTATVICVGTATLGAMIGAGGLGEPIFRGIALVDGPMILTGAVPAAALALLLDWLLGWMQARLARHAPETDRR